MPKFKHLSGADVLKILSLLGFNPVKQRGSHAKVQRVLPDGTRQTLVVPKHDEIDIGTLKAIYRQEARYVPQSELKGHFYSE
jgi:predicted RNA binding protein YcfA (HicA-like mRNA interferase family)